RPFGLFLRMTRLTTRLTTARARLIALRVFAGAFDLLAFFAGLFAFFAVFAVCDTRFVAGFVAPFLAAFFTARRAPPVGFAAVGEGFFAAGAGFVAGLAGTGFSLEAAPGALVALGFSGAFAAAGRGGSTT